MPYEVKINTFQKQGNRLGENQSTKTVTRIWKKVWQKKKRKKKEKRKWKGGNRYESKF